MIDPFKTLVWDNMVTAALSALFVAVPVLNIPVIRQVIEWIARKLTDALYDVAKLAVDFELIVFHNAQYQKDYAHAALNLRSIGQTKGIDSVEFRAAREKHKAALSKFVRYQT